MTDPIRIAVPTKGRLQEPSVQLLRQAGLRFERGERSLSVPVRDTPFELLFVRTEDVPELVADGVAALGIRPRSSPEDRDGSFRIYAASLKNRPLCSQGTPWPLGLLTCPVGHPSSSGSTAA